MCIRDRAVAAQKRIPALQGQGHRYFAGAWMGYGFHEDGLKAGVAAATQLLEDVQTGVQTGERTRRSLA